MTWRATVARLCFQDDSLYGNTAADVGQTVGGGGGGGVGEGDMSAMDAYEAGNTLLHLSTQP
jgi:hypothetical protein